MTKEIILIDCDQCLLNYNQRVANIYEELFVRRILMIIARAHNQ